MASTQVEAMQDWIEKRVADFFERRIENCKTAEEQRIVAQLSREVLAEIRHS